MTLSMGVSICYLRCSALCVHPFGVIGVVGMTNVAKPPLWTHG